jgi:hypothetical protein
MFISKALIEKEVKYAKGCIEKDEKITSWEIFVYDANKVSLKLTIVNKETKTVRYAQIAL